MGIEYNTAEFLLSLKKEEIKFDNILMIGRQSYFLSPKETRMLFKKYNFSSEWTPSKEYPNNYLEDFLKELGAKNIESMDISKEEGATIIHDLNKPISSELYNKFDIVLDSGTLEHIFDVKQAICNYIKMVNIGGKLILNLPTNNFMGHGFYQFSPEFFNTILSKYNGFKIDKNIVIERSPFNRKFNVISPSICGQRCETITFWRTEIFCIATKLFDCEINIHQQSEYENPTVKVEGNKAWQKHEISDIERFIINNFPKLIDILKCIKFSALFKKYRLSNKIAFKRI